MSSANTVLEIIKKNIGINGVDFENKLFDIGINSMDFIKIIVEIEEQYNIEFEDEFLTMEKFELVCDVIEYVETLRQKGEA